MNVLQASHISIILLVITLPLFCPFGFLISLWSLDLILLYASLVFLKNNFIWHALKISWINHPNYFFLQRTFIRYGREIITVVVYHLFSFRICRYSLLCSQYFMENTIFFFHFTDDNSPILIVKSLTQVKPVNDVDQLEHL